MHKSRFENALAILNNQGVIAYPTESVFGLGCDPDSDIAIQKILDLKQRSASKGLILIADNIEQLMPYVDFSELSEMQINRINESWPGNITWIVPSKSTLSPLISGDFDSVAVRVSSHPFVKKITQQFGKPLISTSANLSTLEACKTAEQVELMFSDNPLLEHVIHQPVLGYSSPSKIFDALSGDQLR